MKGNGNAGTYWRLACSRDWRSKTPWSLEQVPVPFIGWRATKDGSVIIRTLGPIALISVTIPRLM